MFEKEAEERLPKAKINYCNSFQCKPDEVSAIEMVRFGSGYTKGFIDGAEFGYNKANEWHYVKDGLPKDNEYVLIYTDLKNTYVARIPTEKDYFITRRGGFVQMSAVIAWKEIVLPKESEKK